ncbi:hypothetical protein M422DRAFT_266934 [Sphaerobolus stellatus SS14]|uniref:Uncharacterized protein n=1 Tax=Sphaerobolus stellatus (strain SS14) TaxID=990650 RepID=A0A0C9V1H3_SPHS4|nr:hypothetical protein M422DRAFT_266934 [Sphaerobolus stellatus SS14]
MKGFLDANRKGYEGDASIFSLIQWYPPQVVYDDANDVARVVIDNDYFKILALPPNDICFLTFYFERLKSALYKPSARNKFPYRWPTNPYEYLYEFIPDRVLKGLKFYDIKPPSTNMEIPRVLQLLEWEEGALLEDDDLAVKFVDSVYAISDAVEGDILLCQAWNQSNRKKKLCLRIDPGVLTQGQSTTVFIAIADSV